MKKLISALMLSLAVTSATYAAPADFCTPETTNVNQEEVQSFVAKHKTLVIALITVTLVAAATYGCVHAYKNDTIFRNVCDNTGKAAKDFATNLWTKSQPARDWATKQSKAGIELAKQHKVATSAIITATAAVAALSLDAIIRGDESFIASLAEAIYNKLAGKKDVTVDAEEIKNVA